VTSLVFFILAAFFEIAGCYSFWAWLRYGRAPWWLIPGILSLILFALCLTRIESAYAGRAYAAYGGIYIASSLVWLRGVEGVSPDRWDLFGAGVSVIGALIVLFGPRQGAAS
jgi:small multidrug resistance family-3 protein